MTSTAQKGARGGRAANRNERGTIASIFTSHQWVRTASLGDLVLPRRRTLLDGAGIGANDDADGHKIQWAGGDIGTIIQIESNLPPNVSHFNRLVRILVPGGAGWCFFDEIKALYAER